MKGLILKDILNLKKQAKVYLILFIFYYIIGMSNKDFTMAGSMITILAAMIPITAMAYDEKCKWDRYALTMPISRYSLVASKYVLGLIFLIAAFLITIVFSLFSSNLPIKENLLINIITFSVGVVVIAIIFPILFKFGVEKGRILMMIVLFTPTVIILLSSNLGFQLPAVDEEVITSLLYLSPIMAFILLAVSILISLSIYKKKEF